MDSRHPPSGTTEFDLSYLQDRIIINRLYGQWNVEGADKVVRQFLDIVQANLAGKDWASLCDMREWELCPPDVMEYFNNSVLEFTKVNLRWQAILPNNRVQKMVVNQYIENTQNGLVACYFHDEEEALEWLRTKIKGQ